MAGLIVAFWFIAGGVALRFLVLFIGVMSCLYVIWDVIGMLSYHESRSIILNLRYHSDDTIARKVNSSDASAFAHICGCCPSQGSILDCHYITLLNLTSLIVWGVFWLIIAFCFFVAGVLVGLVAFKVLHPLF